MPANQTATQGEPATAVAGLADSVDARVSECDPCADGDATRHSEHRRDWLRWILPVHTLAGSLLAIVVLHPVTMVIYCIEFHPQRADSAIWQVVATRMGNAFSAQMWPMTVAFGGIGALLGLWSGLCSRSITRKVLLVSRLDRRFGMAIRSLITAGESATVEFKSSLRWDHVHGKCNKQLEIVIVKTIAGFLNHNGGDLLIGVSDDGSVVGLLEDYETLRKKDRDGFELLLMRLVKDKLGGDVCTLLHIVFHDVDGRDVCRVMIEPSDRPVYVEHDGRARYFVRTGNSTPELDTKEALDHVARRSALDKRGRS